METSFHTSVRLKTAAVAGLTAIATLASSVPAHAEGSRATYIRGWQWGQESGRWRDNHNDAVSTRVAFETCSADTTTFSAPLVLYRVRPALPDVGHGTRINTCNVSNWGTMTTAGDYYFAYTGTRIISVNDVGIYW